MSRIQWFGVVRGSLEIAPINREKYEFQSVFYTNYVPILRRY